MDRGTALVDHAIHTSIRGPMGTGYRLTAVSPGVGRDDQREIVRRAPSHGNLCGEGEDAEGFAAFPLTGGRCALFLSRHAGREPTARGGLRVLTRVFILDDDLQRRLTYDPFRARRVLMDRPGLRPTDPTTGRLAPLSVTDEELRRSASRPAARLKRSLTQVPTLLNLLSAILHRRRTLLPEGDASIELMEAAVAAAPAGLRRGLSFTCGMRHAPQRDADILSLDAGGAELEALQNDRGYAVLDRAGFTAGGGEFDPWLNLARRCWTLGRAGGLHEAADDLLDESMPESLKRISALLMKLDEVDAADLPRLENLIRFAAEAEPLGAVEDRLRTRLLDRAARRKSALLAEEAPTIVNI